MLNILKTIATVSAISAGTVVGGLAVYLHLLHKDLYKEFPEIDRKILREAFNKTLVKAMKGDYDVNQLSDSEVETLFLHQVANI